MALELAARKLTQESNGSLQIIIDSDTQGVPGQPPITDTILQKIRDCDIFVPDFTFVGKTRAGKLLPNPNVLTEYGYALHAKSYAAMMPVMNTAYGPPEELPFDMRHLRHPIQFSLNDGASNLDRRNARKGLAESFEAALSIMIKARIKRVPQGVPFDEAKPKQFRPIGFFFGPSESIASFGNPGEQEYIYPQNKAFYARLFPTYGDQPRVGLVRMVELFQARKVLCMAYQMHDGIFARNEHGPIVLSPSGNNTVHALTQGFATGELWGVNSQVFRTHPELLGGKKGIAIGTISVEKIYVQTLRSYLATLHDELGMRPPYTLELGAVGIQGCYLGLPSVEFSNGQFYGPIGKPEIRIRYSLEQGTEAELLNALRRFFVELYDLVAVSREHILTDEIVAKNDLPSRAET